MNRFIAIVLLVVGYTPLWSQSNIDSIIDSGDFLHAQKEIDKSFGERKISNQIKLLIELKQYSRARKLLSKHSAQFNRITFITFQSQLDVQTGNQQNSIRNLSRELRDSTSTFEGHVLFELSKQYNSIDSIFEASNCIVKSIQLLSESSSDTLKLDQLITFANILSNSGKKNEAIQILNSVQVLSQAAETKLTILKRKQYDTYTDLKKGILFRELGKIDESLASLQSCDFKIHSIDKLWALKIKKALYQAFQITLFIQGNKDKMFAYNIKSSINKEIIDDLIFNYFDQNELVENSNQSEEYVEKDLKQAVPSQKIGLNKNFTQNELINWILIALLILTIGVLSVLLSRRNREKSEQALQIEERDKAFKLYQNQILSQSSSESKKIIQEIGMLSKRQSKWSKKLEEIVEEASKTKKQDIIDAVHSVTQEMQSDVKIDQKKAQLNDNVRKVSNDFKKRLKTRYPDLIRSEIELCALIRLRMSNKEIAEVRNISLSSARTARYRLKKKLNIPENLDIEQVLLAI